MTATRGDLERWAEDATSGLPALCTVEECCKVLRMSKRNFYRKTSGGLIRHVANGTRLLIPRAELQRFIVDAYAA